MRVTNTNELMVQAAAALTMVDVDTLERLKREVQDWLQADEELQAQVAMLDAMIETAEELEH